MEHTLKNIDLVDSVLPLEVNTKDIFLDKKVEQRPVVEKDYIVNKHKYDRHVIKKYSIKGKSDKMVLPMRREYKNKYLLQDIGYVYGVHFEEPTLLIIGDKRTRKLTASEKAAYKEERAVAPKQYNILNIFFINTKEPFNWDIYTNIEIKLDEDGKIKNSTIVNKKIKDILLLSNFYSNRVRLISSSSNEGMDLDFIVEIAKGISKDDFKLKNDMSHMNNKDIKKLFRNCKVYNSGSFNTIIWGLSFLAVAFSSWFLVDYHIPLLQKEKEVVFKNNNKTGLVDRALKTNRKLNKELSSIKSSYSEYRKVVGGNKIIYKGSN